jgi:hypothetical protein
MPSSVSSAKSCSTNLLVALLTYFQWSYEKQNKFAYIKPITTQTRGEIKQKPSSRFKVSHWYSTPKAQKTKTTTARNNLRLRFLFSRKITQKFHLSTKLSVGVINLDKMDAVCFSNNPDQVKNKIKVGKDKMIATLKPNNGETCLTTYSFVHRWALVQGQNVTWQGRLFVMENSFQPVEHLTVPECHPT